MAKNKLKILLIVLMFGFIGVIIAGMFMNSSLMVIGGMVTLFGGAFVVSLIMLAKIIIDVKNERKTEVEDKKSAEEKSKKQVNSTHGYNNRIAQGKRMMHAVADNWAVSDLGDKIKGMLFLFTFIACCVMFVVFASMGKIVWALVSLGAGVGLLLCALIIKVIIEKISMRPSKKIKKGKMDISKYETFDAEVIDCLFSSESYIGTGNKHNSTSRIITTTYKVLLSVNGQQKTAYSKEFYNAGTKVKVLTKNSSKFASIVEVEEEIST